MPIEMENQASESLADYSALEEVDDTIAEPALPIMAGGAGARSRLEDGEDSVAGGDSGHSDMLGARDLSRATSSGELVCRICMEGEEAGKLISPCKCSGSVSLIHTRCLEQWLEQRPGGSSNLKCEICHAPYAITLSERITWRRVYSCVACSHLTEALILMFCLGCMGFMLWIIGPTLRNADASEKTLLIVLFATTLIMSGTALRKVFRRWREASSEPSVEPSVVADQNTLV